MKVLVGLLRNVCRTKENIASRNVKSKFYCGYFCCFYHQVTHVQPPDVLCIYLYYLVHISAQKGYIFVTVLYFYVPSDAYLLLLELYVGGLHVHLK
jgi:hypothetical protein